MVKRNEIVRFRGHIMTRKQMAEILARVERAYHVGRGDPRGDGGKILIDKEVEDHFLDTYCPECLER